MQNRTDFVNVPPRAALGRFLDSNQKRIRLLLGGLLGFMMASSRLFGGAAPFAVALTASAAQGPDAACAAFGAVLGYLVAMPNGSTIHYIAAVILVAAGQWLLGKRKHSGSSAALPTLLTFGALAISSVTVMLASDASIYNVAVYLSEIFLGCGAAYFFTRSRLSMEVGLLGAGRSEISCVIISAAIVLMGFSGVLIGGFSVGRIFSVLIVLICAWYGGEAAGAVSGITAGIAMGISGGDYSYVIASYGFGGLIAGVFSGMGRLAVAGSFVLINAVTAVFTKPNTDVYTVVVEIFVASVLYIAIPPSLASKLKLESLNPSRGSSDMRLTQKAVREKLGNISQALKEICTTTKQVSEKLGAMESGDISGVYTKVADRVCRRCGLKAKCWQFQYNDTMAAMNDCISLLKRTGSLNKEMIPRHFTETCCKLDDFISELNTQFFDHVAKEGVQSKVAKVRSVVTDQFEGIALMIDEIADELSGICFQKEEKTRRVQEYFEKEHTHPRSVYCYTDDSERLTVEVVIPTYETGRLNKTRITLDLCALLEAELDIPEVSVRDQSTTYTFTEKATYTVMFGAYQIASEGNRLCGDAYDYIRNRRGHAHFIISDGMGSGGSAAVDSAMTASLLSRMISVGISHEAALKLVNSALLIKSGEESLATIDILSLDLYTGRASFYKAGAAPTFLLKGGKAGYVESTSLPVGILRGVAFEKSSVQLKEGDTVVMASDGVIATGAEWVQSELESSRKQDVQRLCEKLANTAKARRTDGREDDITVLAIRLCKGT